MCHGSSDGRSTCERLRGVSTRHSCMEHAISHVAAVVCVTVWLWWSEGGVQYSVCALECVGRAFIRRCDWSAAASVQLRGVPSARRAAGRNAMRWLVWCLLFLASTACAVLN